MERILSQDERIRRAEEIYARRQNLRERTKKATLNVSNKNKNLKVLKRIMLQAIICVLIYFIFYLINTTNYSFSESALSWTEEMISKDMNFEGIYQGIVSSFNNYVSSMDMTAGNNIIEENNMIQEEAEAKEESSSENQINNLGLLEENAESTGQLEIKDITLSETDRIKQNYSFIVPTGRTNIIRIWRKRSNYKHNVYIS